jgi:hypothetical protein
MDTTDQKSEKSIVCSKLVWTDYDETTLEKSIKELEKWKFTEHERVFKKFRK